MATNSISAAIFGSNGGSGPGAADSNSSEPLGQLEMPTREVSGLANKTNTHGVFAENTNSSTGGYLSGTAAGAHGTKGSHEGWLGYSSGVVGLHESSNNQGLLGAADAGLRACGHSGYVIDDERSSDPAAAIRGVTTVDNGIGIEGRADSGTGAWGVYGVSNSEIGVYGTASSSHAGHFQGKVHVNGALSKSSGSFKIDHPLDPENRYLNHSFVQSPDMMNVYNGNVVLGEAGEAWLEPPAWF